MIRSLLVAVWLLTFVTANPHRLSAQSLPEDVLDSVVSVLPVWPGKPQGGGGTPPGAAPEGSGVVVGKDGLVATAFHVIEPAERIDVRLADGRILPAELIGQDEASDIALLKVPEDLPLLETAPHPSLASRACVISNAYGLGLSVTCGVVSARHVSNAGFNPVEDFIQTDAAANPGSSGGALVDGEGRLVGMVSAIFASRAETNIGVNFAVSSALLARVIEDLSATGKVSYVSAGWGLENPSRAELQVHAGAKIASLASGGPAQQAGLKVGDLILALNDRTIRSPRGVISALALVRHWEGASVTVLRGGRQFSIDLQFPDQVPVGAQQDRSDVGLPDCPYAHVICRTRQAVFPVESFDPLASATRIDTDLLVTNRHVVADRTTVVVFTPSGPLRGEVIPSSYRGDLALIRVDGLPEDGAVLTPAKHITGKGPLHAVGADIARRQVRVFAPGEVILLPATDAELGRLHITSRMQPGVSGGALVDSEGRLVGIAAGGGEGRFEALPAQDVLTLLAGRNTPDALAVHGALGRALALCSKAMEQAGANPASEIEADLVERISETCQLSRNQGQYLEAGRLLGMAGALEEAITLHQAAVDQVPNSLNARLSLLTSMQLAGRYEAMLTHARFVLENAPQDPRALRIAIQSGVWGGDQALARQALAQMKEVDATQAEAASRFIESPPPKPIPR
ncbi:trypsin-like peptidase domain-containing protein [Roseibium polysiphoniae]|uniref:Trypsin-like peptidase domain-containing protein n=1 Tax=Roseibium polysiphoniae TaxID=2571221 RepID=A0ABR9C645_9HYPH|nr:trypsin-like peptidase domain-containing protein [Roseibium polysiphoniae]MBD8874969.1 trypsin-like peptidase domain-containing protein [Roseibium polysiphoniae]